MDCLRQKGASKAAAQERRAPLEFRRFKNLVAREHDTQHFEAVIDPGNTSRDIFADKGYVDGEREARLKGRNWRMQIQRRGSED